MRNLCRHTNLGRTGRVSPREAVWEHRRIDPIRFRSHNGEVMPTHRRRRPPPATRPLLDRGESDPSLSPVVSGPDRVVCTARPGVTNRDRDPQVPETGPARTGVCRRGTARALAHRGRIATMLALVGCATLSPADAAQRQRNDVLLDVREWNPTTVRLHCGRSLVKTVHSAGTDQRQLRITTAHCRTFHATAEVFGESGVRTSGHPLVVGACDELRITIPHAQAIVHVIQQMRRC
jgi:hypothetical protein